MAKKVLSLRLDGEALEWVDSYAASREVSRQAVLDAAVASFGRRASGGVPDFEPERKAKVRPARPVSGPAAVGRVGAKPEPVVTQKEVMAERQVRLNRALGR